ncbi:variant 2, Mitochondrial intermediate peptidase [Lathyrus oleraceus]|uniref:Variant 2, Mitochondrial intermediate peptidase n=1 Tax=Pisum sativum TaxID=3888 RepID=A0A9D4X0P3_PEA|nr:variant 2, Mitochondrial intermediate peptidase [Pisum sativum]
MLRRTLALTVARNKTVQIFRHNLPLLRRRRNFSTTGLYGIPHLKSPNGFQSFVDEAIQRSGELVSYISTKPSASEIMRAMDEISDTVMNLFIHYYKVCSVVDSAELCRQTHPNREFVEEADKASMKINEYLHYLNTSHDIYDAVKKAELECHMLSEETQRGIKSLRVDMERGGIHLCPEKLDRVNKLDIEISHLCRKYNENIIIDPGTVDIYPSSRFPKNLHHLVKPIYKSKPSLTKDLLGSKDTLKEKGFRITTDSRTLDSVLQLSSDDEIRKMVYIRGNSVPHANVDVLQRLISARHEQAQIMGCGSYAELAVKPNLASSPKVVMSFLLEMSKMVQEKSTEELKLLSKFKREKCGQAGGDIRPWDEAYYTTMMKSSVYKLDSSVVASYFSLSNCIEGLKVLVKSLFGVICHKIPLAPGESWDPQVLKLCLHHPNEGDLGYLYLDLYSRKGKYPGCAHFAIKGGRRISQTEYQLPRMYKRYIPRASFLSSRALPWLLRFTMKVCFRLRMSSFRISSLLSLMTRISSSGNNKLMVLFVVTSFIDLSPTAPAIPQQFPSSSDSVLNVANSAYLDWEQQDTLICTWLLSTISDSLLPKLVDCRHSWQHWKVVLTEPVSVNLTPTPLSLSPVTTEHSATGMESFPLGTSHATANAENHGYNSRDIRKLNVRIAPTVALFSDAAPRVRRPIPVVFPLVYSPLPIHSRSALLFTF